MTPKGRRRDTKLLEMRQSSFNPCLVLLHVRTQWPVFSCRVHGQVWNSLLQNWKLTLDGAQANIPICRAWQGLHDRPMKTQGNDLEEKSMAAANTGEPLSRDKDAFCPIKYPDSGVFPLSSLNAYHLTVLSSSIIKSNPIHAEPWWRNKTQNRIQHFYVKKEQSQWIVSL